MCAAAARIEPLCGRADVWPPQGKKQHGGLSLANAAVKRPAGNQVSGPSLTLGSTPLVGCFSSFGVHANGSGVAELKYSATNSATTYLLMLQRFRRNGGVRLFFF